MTMMPPARRKLLLRLTIFAAVLLTFGRILTNDFVEWDDRVLIYNNPNLNPPTLAGLAHHWVPADPANVSMYNPLVFTTWWSLAHTARLGHPDLLGSSLNPFPFHLANLLFHAAAACLTLDILLCLGVSSFPALAGALLFALHPVQTEPIAWATGLKDVMSGFFALAAILQYLKSSSAEKISPARYMFATALVLLALLAKPSVVVVPAMLMAIDILLRGVPAGKSFARMLPWFALAAIATLIATRIQLIHDLPPEPLAFRPLIAADAISFDLGKIILPFNLSPDYGRTPTALMLDPAHPLRRTWVYPATIAILVVSSRNRKLIAASLVILLGILPVLGLKPFMFQFFSTVADRYLYLSMLGVAMVFAWLLESLNTRRATVIASFLLFVMAVLSCVQAGVWKNTRTLFEHAEALNPDRINPLHLNVLGKYYDRLAYAAGQTAGPLRDRAIQTYRRSLELDPLFPQVYNDLTNDLILAGRPDEAAAAYRGLISVQPRLDPTLREPMAKLQYKLGSLLLRAGRIPDAIDQFQQSAGQNPDSRKMLELIRPQTPATSQPASPTPP